MNSSPLHNSNCSCQAQYRFDSWQAKYRFFLLHVVDVDDVLNFVFSRVHATLHPALSVRLLVRPSDGHTLLFLGLCGFWPHSSCPNDLVTLVTAPAHPHATGVAVYPALIFLVNHWCNGRLRSLGSLSRRRDREVRRFSYRYSKIETYNFRQKRPWP